MNRRSFIRGIIAAAIAPCVIANISPDRFKWQSTKEGILIPGHDEAPYEMAFLFNPYSGSFETKPRPIRFYHDNGKFIPVC